MTVTIEKEKLDFKHKYMMHDINNITSNKIPFNLINKEHINRIHIKKLWETTISNVLEIRKQNTPTIKYTIASLKLLKILSIIALMLITALIHPIAFLTYMIIVTFTILNSVTTTGSSVISILDTSKYIGTIQFNQTEINKLNKTFFYLDYVLFNKKEELLHHKYNEDYFTLHELLYDYDLSIHNFIDRYSYVIYQDTLYNSFTNMKSYNDCVRDLLIPNTNLDKMLCLSKTVKYIVYAEKHGIDKNFVKQYIQNHIIKTTIITTYYAQDIKDLWDKKINNLNDISNHNTIVQLFKDLLRCNYMISKTQYNTIELEISIFHTNLMNIKTLQDKNPTLLIQQDLETLLNNLSYEDLKDNDIEIWLQQLKIINKNIALFYQERANFIMDAAHI